MPKMKTHKGAAKRFKITGTGRVVRMKGYRGHNKMKKNKRQLHAMREMQPVQGKYAKTVKSLLPYGN